VREQTGLLRKKGGKKEITGRDLISRRYLHGSSVFSGKRKKNEEKKNAEVKIAL